MAKLTLNGDTPTEAIVKNAKKVAETTDSLGRHLTVRKLNALDKVDLAQILGPDRCKNEAVLGPCALAFSVTKIDGEPIMAPVTYNELRLLIQRLDDEGLEAVGLAAIEHFGIETQADEEERRGAVKNS